MSWDKEPPKKQELEFANVGSWDSEPPPKPQQKPSYGLTAVRKGLQGATAGFSDEFAGGVEAVGRAAGLEGLGGPMKDIKLSEEGPTLNSKFLKEAYVKGRDKEREGLRLDSKFNPKLSTTAEIGGAVLSPINKVGKGLSLAKQGAIMGGITGAGNSEAEDASGLVEDTAKGAVIGGLLGKGAEYGANKLQDGFAKIAAKISTPKQKINAEQIKEAADRLGIKVTPAMLDDSGFVERLEYTLTQSPSFIGQNIASKQKNVSEGLKKSVQDLTSESTNLSPFQVGEKFKSGVTAKVGERLSPISSVFDEVAESTKNMPLSDRAKNTVIRNIQADDYYALTGGAGKAKQYVDMITNAKNVDQVKSTMTLLNKDIQAAQGAEKLVLISIKDKLARLEESSIMRAAGSLAKKDQGIGRDLVGDLRDARKGYRQLSEDLSGVAENARIKSNKGPSAFLDEVENIPSEKVQDKFFNVENNRQLVSLQKNFPEEFELLRQGKLKEISDGSIDFSQNGQGKESSARFLRAIRNLNPESQSMLFKEGAGKIADLQTVQNSLPRNFNPSGTAGQSRWSAEALYSNVKDIPTYLLYRGASSNLAKQLGEKLASSPGTVKFLENNPAAVKALIEKIESGVPIEQAMPMVADKPEASAPLRGQDKWASEGAEKLKSHGMKDMRLLESLKQSQYGRELLQRASDLKPGSPGMEKLFTEIKKLSGGPKDG